MTIEIFRGLPYNKWVSWSEFQASGTKDNPFDNFKLTKGNFFLQVTTNWETGEKDITLKLPFNIHFSV